MTLSLSEDLVPATRISELRMPCLRVACAEGGGYILDGEKQAPFPSVAMARSAPMPLSWNEIKHRAIACSKDLRFHARVVVTLEAQP